MVASSLGVLVVFGTVSTLVMGMYGWSKGQGAIDSNVDGQKSIRVISSELKEAMEVTLDANGLGLNYKLPLKDGTGLYVQPMTWDGVTRRVQYRVVSTVGRIEYGPSASMRTLATNVSNINPSSGNSYQIFTAGDGTVIRELKMRLTTDNAGRNSERQKTLTAETFFLRNIPVTTR